MSITTLETEQGTEYLFESTAVSPEDGSLIKIAVVLLKGRDTPKLPFAHRMLFSTADMIEDSSEERIMSTWICLEPEPEMVNRIRRISVRENRTVVNGKPVPEGEGVRNLLSACSIGIGRPEDRTATELQHILNVLMAGPPDGPDGAAGEGLRCQEDTQACA